MSAVADPTSKQKTYDLLDDLPPEALDAVEGFVRFLREQIKKAQTTADVVASARTVPLSDRISAAGNLSGLVGLMPPVGGDALAETEAIYEIEG
jgi:hypothetical protein